jgi:hypothetical protein
LFAFDPWRQAILLVAGDKSGDWKGWYRTAIKIAEQLYDDRAAIRGLAGYVEALGGHLELVANLGDERLVIG